MDTLIKSGLNSRVLAHPRPPTVDLIVSNNDTLLLDATIRVDCVPAGTNTAGYSLEWTRHGDQMPRRSYVDKNSLVINRFETGYLGKYSCIVSNDYGRTVKTIQFFEEYPGILGFKVDQEQLREPSLKRLKNRHFRVLIGSDRPRLGDTIAVECLNLGPNSQVGPKWRRRLGETLKSYDLPHILVIRRIGLSDVG